MSALLHSIPWAIAAVTATSAAAGYPASNVTIPSCGRPWRSGAPSPTNLDIDLGAIRSPVVLCLQAPNTPTCTVSYGSASYTTTSAGTQALALDRHGRRKMSLQLLTSARYIRVVFSGVTPDDGASYFSVGAVYCFGASLALPEDPLIGSEATARYPQTDVRLPNGVEFAIDRGDAGARQELALRFRGPRATDLAQIERAARRGVCWLDLGLAANRELQWPVRHAGDTLDRRFSSATQDEAAVRLREVA